MQIAGPRRLRPEPRDRGDEAALRHRPEDDRRLRPAVPAGAPAGGARRALRAALPHHRRLPAVGPAQRPQGRPRQERPGDRPAHRRPAAGPAGPRAAGGHAGDLGRRVRPHAGRRRDRTAATITPTASPCGWPAAASAAAWPTARPTSSAGTPSRTGSTSTTCTPRSCTCSGLDHEKLTYRHAGRDYRLTDVYGNVVRDILA